ANVLLTAYGLMEFRDMAAVHDVDKSLIERTRQWLLSKRDRDGSWYASLHLGRSNAPALDRLRATAYVAWAVFGDSPMEAGLTQAFLLKHAPESIADPYVLALVGNALLAIDPKGEAGKPYLDRLAAIKRSSPDGRLTWWELPSGNVTAFYGAGNTATLRRPHWRHWRCSSLAPTPPRSAALWRG